MSNSSVVSVLRMRLQGANASTEISGLDDLPTRSSYFMGNDRTRWKTGVRTYARVQYKEVYPGIDLIFYGNQQKLEYDFVVKPGSDPQCIALSVEGASDVRIGQNGDLHLKTIAGDVEFKKPVVYQEYGSSRQEIAAGYRLENDSIVKFALGEFNHSQPLIVDPAVDYSTYLGGSGDDSGWGIAVDANGNTFVAGNTMSTDFPTTSDAINPTPQAPTSNGAIYVAEIDPTGTSLLYSTYISGNGGETATELALDSANPPNVFITGVTYSSNFPTTANAYLANFTPSSGGTAFVTKFNPAITGLGALEYSTYLGGSSSDFSDDIVVDAAGNMYVTGTTSSTNFPVTAGAFQSANRSTSGSNAFVTRLDPTKSGVASLIYSTYLGGSGNDAGIAIAVDSAANAYVATSATSSDYPTTATAFMQTPPVNPIPYYAGAVTRLDTSLTGSASLIYSSYLGGTIEDGVDDIVLGPNNLAYTTGWTYSSDFPVTVGAYRTTPPSNIGNQYTATLTVFDTSQSGTNSLIYSTFLGGNSIGGCCGEEGIGMAVDSGGNAYVTGETSSSSFPVTQGAFQTAMNGTCGNAFISELMPLGNGAADLVYSTFYGGSGPARCNTWDYGYNIALDSANSAYVTGTTYSTDLPVVPSNAFQTSLSGPSDAFVAKLSMTPKVLPTPSISSLSTTSGSAGTLVMVSGSNFGMNQGTSTVTFGGVAAPVVSWSSSSIVAQVPSNTITDVVQVSVKTNVGPSNPQPFTVTPAVRIALSAASLSFDARPVNSSSDVKSISVTNAGTAPLNFTGIVVTGAKSADFTQTNTCGQSLAPSAKCNFNVVFSPQASGVRNALITITDNAPDTPQSISLTGIGQDFSVNLSSGQATISGTAASYDLTVSPISGFAQTVNLTCSVLPAAQCAISPTSLALNGSTPSKATVTITSGQNATAMSGLAQGRSNLVAATTRPFILLIGLCLFQIATNRKATQAGTRLARVYLLGMLFVLASLGVAACNQGVIEPKSNTYAVTVSATSGSLTHNTTIQIVIQ
jgi:hypothetical protein